MSSQRVSRCSQVAFREKHEVDTYLFYWIKKKNDASDQFWSLEHDTCGLEGEESEATPLRVSTDSAPLSRVKHVLIFET